MGRPSHRHNLQTTPASPSQPAGYAGSDRRPGWLAFFESNFVIGPVGVIGGLVGVFFYTPVCLICDVCVLLGLHRSGAVAGKSKGKQAFYYLLVFAVTTALLVVAE
jgi:hypothetical protein